MLPLHMRKAALLLLILVWSTSHAQVTLNERVKRINIDLYKVSFIQAAPGKLLELIELQKARIKRVFANVFGVWHARSESRTVRKSFIYRG